jgi:hypothetical protein
MGIGLEALRDGVKATMSPGHVIEPSREEIGLSSSARRVVELARHEAHRNRFVSPP